MAFYSKSSLNAIILAGGQSSRMGKDKALLLIDGIPLLQKIYTVASDCTQNVYVISPWIEQYTSILPQSCHFIRENTPTHGPLVAFFLALNHVESDWILLLACDLPLLTSEIVQQWANSLPGVPETAIAYLPKQDDLWHPLCGFYRRCCLASLEYFIKKGGRSFQGWLNQSTVQQILVSDPRVLLNCNTPQDLLF
ncbi:molybdenum cofactor guanylyltransferase [Aphanothece hegewaldii CCALA 016]|uniref:Probable molybdenum cofactor guanylyltransferase n=1 Tax=Aphanothece hegewaldii CCALA 016 TaxID=2107694 RepID=A0A2T1LST2_9CHRO|nr:molybdenum cofactor guanylyltransferase [Aphanothece hegewaldii]PSF32951.1 molybdenum cofactor guanylyltransferase [Aphanothece hegewaldii CCALA 016]